MANKRKGKLELDWVDKGDIILTKFDDKGKTYPASYFQGQVCDEELMPRELELIESVGDPNSENMLIWGENLIALRSLERQFADRIKLIYIDPPFNTGQDFEDYEDGLEHSIWLSMMENRLRLAQKLLKDDGLLCVHINHHEYARLKLLLDEIMSPTNYIDSISLKVRHEDRILKGDKYTHDVIEYVLLYSGKREAFRIAKRKIDSTDFSKYCYEVKIRANGVKQEIGNKLVEVFAPNQYEIVKSAPSRNKLQKINIRGSIKEGNSSGRFYEKFLAPRVQSDGHATLYKVPGIGDDSLEFRYFTNPIRQIYRNGHYFQGVPESHRKIRELPYPNFLDIIGPLNRVQVEGGVIFRNAKKTEVLLKFLIVLSNPNPGDIVLDYFAGSGTTGGVAHKMGFRWIMVEIGEQAKKVCVERMKNVINGDQTGVSKEVSWNGGGGFKFYKLGEPLIVKHKDYRSIRIINPKYYNTALIKVICDLERFKFSEDDKVLHGVNKLGNKYAHVTEQYVSQSYLDFLKSKLADNEEMVVYCFSYDERILLPLNMIIKKLPADIGKSYQMRLKI